MQFASGFCVVADGVRNYDEDAAEYNGDRQNALNIFLFSGYSSLMASAYHLSNRR